MELINKLNIQININKLSILEGTFVLQYALLYFKCKFKCKNLKNFYNIYSYRMLNWKRYDFQGNAYQYGISLKNYFSLSNF